MKRRGKSSPLAEQFARQEKPHAVQDRTEVGQPVRRSSGIVASRWTGAAPKAFGAGHGSPGVPRKRGEINDHPPKKFGDRIRLIAIEMGALSETKAPFLFS